MMDVREKLPSEKRLIDANALIKEANADGAYGYVDAKQIANAQTIDAVEVVRCKDCKHYKPQKKSAHWENRTNYCNRIVTVKVQPDDFCSYGERKEGADNG